MTNIITNSTEFLSFEKQLELFKDRGMIISDEHKALKKIETIGYYKIKGFAYALVRPENCTEGYNNVSFEGVKFDEVILRYYQDKNLRIYLLHAIEKIEVSVKVGIAYVLGKNYGAFNYKDFSKWTNRKKYTKVQRQQKETEFCKELKEKVKRSALSSYDLTPADLDQDGMPSIWLAVDILTFGDIVHMLNMMSAKNLEEISQSYDIDKDTFLSWMYCLKFIRNLCAHNSNIIDVKLRTTPKKTDDWEHYLYKNSQNQFTDKIAVVIMIIKQFISKINPQYRYDSIYKSFYKMISGTDIKASNLGFKNYEAFTKACPLKNNHFEKKKRK